MCGDLKKQKQPKPIHTGPRPGIHEARQPAPHGSPFIHQGHHIDDY